MGMMGRAIRIAALAACFALPAPPLPAQQARLGAAAEQQLPTIRVDVEVVNVLCTVKDRKGRLVNTLSASDFEILEDGQRQTIRYFSRETDLPLTIGLLVDTSVSQFRLVPAEKEAAETFLHRVLGPKDLAFLISFDTDVDLLQDFSSSLALLRRGLEKLRVNAPVAPVSLPTVQGPFPGLRRGGTHFHDAVYLAAREKLAAEVGRKAVVVITDGQDQGSKVKLEEAIEAAQKADVIVYGILFYDPAFYGFRFAYSGEGALKKLAEETGGRMIRVDRSRDLAAAFEEIAQELRSQYSLGYTPTNARRDGRFRRLRVQALNQELRVQARKGYYAPGGGQE